MFNYDKTPRYHPKQLSSYQIEHGRTGWYIIATSEEGALSLANLQGKGATVTQLTQGTAPTLYTEPTVVLVQHKPYKGGRTSK